MAIPESPGLDPLIPRVEVRPPSSMTDRLRELLQSLRNIGGFVSAAVSRRDGLVIHHTLRNPHEAAILCAMAAALVGSSKTTGAELGKGAILHGIIRYERGVLVVSEAGPEAVLACLLSAQANLGHAVLMVEKVSEKVSEVLAEL